MNGMQDFHYAISLAQTLYDIEMNDIDKAEEIGLVAYNLIGNHHTALYRSLENIERDTGRVELPCNCLYVESVTVPCHEDWETSSNIHEFGDTASAAIEDSIEVHKEKLDPLYQSGSLIKYRQEGNFLRIDPRIKRVSILYHGEILDEDGLPYLSNAEALAIADYIGYIMKYKEAIKTNNENAMAISKDLESKWYLHCNAARAPEYLSQNDLDKIMEAQVSWNRKKYHFSYKPTI